MTEQYDIIVVGGGHAGCEAAHIAARMGARTILVTIQPESIARMPCNPAIGGLAKGHLVREIDVLGGLMARAIDATGIQFRMLNMSKGPAVRAPRAQADRHDYASWMLQTLENTPRLDLRQGMAESLMVNNNGVCGIVLKSGSRIKARSVILTTGTFLDGKVYIGLKSYPAGRAGEPPANNLSKSLKSLKLQLGRFMTDTPPRLDHRSIDYSGLEVQPGDDPPVPFSFSTLKIERDQAPCYITYTNPETHRIIRENIEQSPAFAGKLDAAPPRYCPDIETKIIRFPDRDRHQIFLEPEGIRTPEVYPNGIFTTLPEDVQVRFIHTIKGLEHARMTRPAYGIEYTYVNPTQLSPILEVRGVPGLFLAGQINGTSGYEEAAAQGILAGINAVLKLREQEPLILGREEAYAGVLIDDLVNKGTEEPYRMFTSRAEYRLLLRSDNADLRLMEHARRIGTVAPAQYETFCRYRDSVEKELHRLQAANVKTTEIDREYLKQHKLGDVEKSITLAQLLSRPEMTYQHLIALGFGGGLDCARAIDQVEISAKYSGYIKKQLDEIERMKKMEKTLLPGNIDYGRVRGLTREASEKLAQRRPRTLGQASRISGISPADITILLIHLKKQKEKK